MKNNSFFRLAAVSLCLAFGVSSCIKVVDEPVNCPNKPAKPTTTSATYAAVVGDSLYIPITNAQAGVTYTLTGPNNAVYTSDAQKTFDLSITSLSQEGTYTLKAVNLTNSCQADLTSISVDVSIQYPFCGIAEGIFKPSSSSTITLSNGTGYQYTYYYKTVFYSTMGSHQMDISFGKKPSQTEVQAFTVTNYHDANDLTDDECRVFYDHNDGYDGSYGVVYTKFENGKYHFTFCNATLYNYYYGSYYGAKASVSCTP